MRKIHGSYSFFVDKIYLGTKKSTRIDTTSSFAGKVVQKSEESTMDIKYIAIPEPKSNLHYHGDYCQMNRENVPLNRKSIRVNTT
jgi:hypothetical protein